MEFELWTNIQISRLIDIIRVKASSEYEYKSLLNNFSTLCSESINTYNNSYELESELKSDIMFEFNRINKHLNDRIDINRL